MVNDGSTDRSGEVLEKYRMKGVKVVTEKCGSASGARNRAFREAKGDYVKFFDADDILSPEMVQKQVERLGGRKDAVAMSEWGRFYNNDIRTYRPNPQTVWKDMSGVDWLVEAIQDGQPMMQVGMFLIPRTLIDKAGPWNEKLTLTDDFEYFCRLFCITKQILFTSQASLHYRSGISGSLSAQKTQKARESECNSILLGTGHILKHRKDSQANLSCANACQYLIYDLYPKYLDLRKKLKERVKECGQPTIKPSGGRYFHLLRKVVGWKLARHIQKAFEKRYKKI